MKYKNLVTVFIITIQFFIFALPALAGPELGMNYIEPLHLANGDPRSAAVSLIGLLMTFLGIIAVVIMLYGGFTWMTAAGNEEKVSKAKKIIGAGIIGLIVVLASYLIVDFVTKNVSNSLGD